MASDTFRLIDLLDELEVDEDIFFRHVRTAKDVMTTRVGTLSLRNTVQDALKFMKDNNCRHIPIMDAQAGEGGTPMFASVVSERDLLRYVPADAGTAAQSDEVVKARQTRLAEIVPRRPRLVSPNTSMTSVIQTMIDNRVDMLPVLLRQVLVGIITSSDIVRVFVMLGKISRFCKAQEGETKVAESPSGKAKPAPSVLSQLGQTVQDIMTKEVACLNLDDTLARAMDAMRTGMFRHMPVVNERRQLAGVVSDRDVLMILPPPGEKFRKQSAEFRQDLFALDPTRPPKFGIRVEEIMNRQVVHVSPGTGVFEAARKFHDQKVGCLPVVNEGKKLLGIVTVTDLMRTLLAAYKHFNKPQG